MNILHFLEKLELDFLHFINDTVLPYTLIIYLIDIICIYRVCKKFKEPVWQAFVPVYNWRVIFKYCWNDKAFLEHLFIEITIILIIPIFESLVNHEIIDFVIFVIDLIISIIGLKHAIEVNIFNLKSYGYNEWYYIPLMFFFNGALILCTFGKHDYLGNFSEE